MTMGIVERLEVVNIHKNQGQRPLIPTGSLPLLLKHLIEMTAVGQPGQGIFTRKAIELLRQLIHLALFQLQQFCLQEHGAVTVLQQIAQQDTHRIGQYHVLTEMAPVIPELVVTNDQE
jgi:hypothetical protein